MSRIMRMVLYFFVLWLNDFLFAYFYLSILSSVASRVRIVVIDNNQTTTKQRKLWAYIWGLLYMFSRDKMKI